MHCQYELFSTSIAFQIPKEKRLRTRYRKVAACRS